MNPIHAFLELVRIIDDVIKKFIKIISLPSDTPLTSIFLSIRQYLLATSY